MGLDMKGIIYIIANFQCADFLNCSHSSEGKPDLIAE